MRGCSHFLSQGGKSSWKKAENITETQSESHMRLSQCRALRKKHIREGSGSRAMAPGGTSPWGALIWRPVLQGAC